jgi:hypothetical protein
MPSKTQTRRDFVKDVSLAFLSVNALLLTLVLGFVSPAVSGNPFIKMDVAIAAVMFYVSGGCSATVLYSLARGFTENLPYERMRSYLLIELLPLLLGLAAIVASIIFKLLMG